MSIKVTATDQAPAAIGPYSQASVAGGMVFCSGQIGLIPGTSDFAGPDVKTQTKQVMKNLQAVLEASGSSLDKVLRCSIFLEDMRDFSVVNEIYGRYFTSHLPARETVAVSGLPKAAKIEISCIALV